MSVAPQAIVAAWLARFEPLRYGFSVHFWDGRTAGSPDAPVRLVLREARACKVFLRPTTGNLARAYVEELIDIEGNLREIIEVGVKLGRVAVRQRAPILFYPWHSRRTDQRAVQYHYDLSNDFYGLWLDRNRVYSCAYFNRADDTLDQAQAQKLDHICGKLLLSRGDRLLDIGCGWGGLILHAARHYGARCVGITLSQEQFRYVLERIRALGLEHLCDVRLLDYRDLSDRERFNKIASVGMFEHVGRRNLQIYFQKIADLLEPGGLLLNHGIAASWMQGETLGSDVGDFIDRFVFPDGELVHLSEGLNALGRCGLEVLDVEGLRSHYARTLWQWVGRLDRHADEARKLVGERAYRIWRIYMAGSAHAFEQGWISIYQTLAHKCNDSGDLHYPLTRAHLYENRTPPTSPVQGAQNEPGYRP